MSVEVQLFPNASCLLSLTPYTKVPTEANLTIPCLLILHLNRCLGINLHIHRSSEATKKNPLSTSLDFRWWKSILLPWFMLCVCVCEYVWLCVHWYYYTSNPLWRNLSKNIFNLHLRFSSVQFSHSVVSDSLRPHELQHVRPPCPSPIPGFHPNPCPSSQ